MPEIDKNENAVTILTIAKMANVSHTTVSRALNGSALVKPATRDKITKIAQQVGYVPNLSAKRLVTNRSYMIGIFFTNLDTGTSASFLTEVIEQAQGLLPKGYSLSINSVDNAMDEQGISVSNFDGIIVISQSASDDEFIEYLHKTGIPIVVLNRVINRNDINNYAVGDELGGKIATEYAIRMGHRKFALIKGLNEFESSAHRTKGFMDALDAHDIKADPKLVKQGDYQPKSGNVLMRQILSGGDIPSCVICENDDMALGALNACIELGYQVPRDISIIGFDDMGYSKYLVPPLTTVRKPTSTIIGMGVSRLVEMMEDKQHDDIEQKVVNPEIIVRSSVLNMNKIDFSRK
ncbi:putative HTH-type transcriptional repressor ExuR [Lentilactobacillus sunkii]|jgi:LacI family purine nucleotide synthesis repressor|uniref:Putative HTH-type transcriptional repressor ExuR n=1 Tax=Lentilactobacillus sunkii TaxID=481719 RepID=A0A1E7XJ75_9LACO|nr:LacI family DNA-binding transcriptional regulator [Lentilactobacillus sunkii]OFA13088.1 putative HTH-type transcriptional repressor ExuR [Lentilactobacillus sunkii]